MNKTLKDVFSGNEYLKSIQKQLDEKCPGWSDHASEYDEEFAEKFDEAFPNGMYDLEFVYFSDLADVTFTKDEKYHQVDTFWNGEEYDDVNMSEQADVYTKEFGTLIDFVHNYVG